MTTVQGLNVVLYGRIYSLHANSSDLVRTAVRSYSPELELEGLFEELKGVGCIIQESNRGRAPDMGRRYGLPGIRYGSKSILLQVVPLAAIYCRFGASTTR